MMVALVGAAICATAYAQT